MKFPSLLVALVILSVGVNGQLVYRLTPANGMGRGELSGFRTNGGRANGDLPGSISEPSEIDGFPEMGRTGISGSNGMRRHPGMNRFPGKDEFSGLNGLPGTGAGMGRTPTLEEMLRAYSQLNNRGGMEALGINGEDNGGGDRPQGVPYAGGILHAGGVPGNGWYHWSSSSSSRYP